MIRRGGGGGGSTRARRPAARLPWRPTPQNRGRGRLGMPEPPERDYFAEFNAWQDPNIGGQQPGAVQQGYGGFGALDSMTQTKMNNWLNQFSVGGDRERAMNALGYFNAGNPYTPQVQKGYNRELRGRAQGNQRTGGYSAPGVYQHQSTPAEMYQPGYSGDFFDFGGYTGITNVDPNGAARYTPFDRNAGEFGGPYSGRTRRTRTFGQVRY